MTDRFLARCMWMMVMALIAGSAFGGLVLLYSGIFSIIVRQFETGVASTCGGMGLALICYLLCKHSEDLMDRRLN